MTDSDSDKPLKVTGLPAPSPALVIYHRVLNEQFAKYGDTSDIHLMVQIQQAALDAVWEAGKESAEVEWTKDEDIDAWYFPVSKKPVDHTRQVTPGLVNFDYDIDGNVVGVEILGD